ncbi:MAG TPA: peptidyl-prolyl cis-trans isomerase [Paenibacillaceae bacterium]
MRLMRRHWAIVLLALAGIAGLGVWTAIREGWLGAAHPGDASPSEPASEELAGKVVGRVGGVEITREELTRDLLDRYGEQALRDMLLRIAAEKEADALGITVTEEEVSRELRIMAEGYDSEEQFYRTMKEQLGLDRDRLRQETRYQLLLEKLTIASVSVTEDEIRRYWEEHAEEFAPREQLRISRIVLADREEAEKILDLLEKGEDFAELAGLFSLDGFTAASGGDLGWVEEDDPFVPRAVLEAVAGLETGSVIGPVETENGFEVVMLTGRRTIPAPDPQETREEIRRRLALEKAPSLRELEEALLAKYGAEMMLEGEAAN